MTDNMEIKHEILGQGNDGIILYPSLDGDFNKVTKVGRKTKIEYEKSIILPLFLSGYLYLNPEDYEYSEISPEEYLKFTGRKTTKIYYGLTMKKLEGETLFEFYEKSHATVENWTNDISSNYRKNFITLSLNSFKELYLRLQIFQNLCQMMNSAGVYHNDIGSHNIMITKDKQLFLIDFYNLTLGSPLKLPFLKIQRNDIDCVNSLFEELIDVGLFDPEVYQYCVENSLIVPFDIDYNPSMTEKNYHTRALSIISRPKRK